MTLNFSSFNLLLENREDFLKQKHGKEIIELYQKKYPHDATWRTIPDKTLDTLFGLFRDSIDPTRNKIYMQWIVGQHLKWLRGTPGFERWAEDFLAIHRDLSEFERVKGRMPGDQRDINRYKTYYDLRRAIEPYLETKSGKEIKRDEVEAFRKEIRTVYEGPDVRIYIPKSEKSSCFLGRGTKWCTAAENSYNYYNHYSKNGPLIVFIFPDGRKFQLHNESGQFMNEQDYQVDIKKWVSEYAGAVKRLMNSGVVGQEVMYKAIKSGREFLHLYAPYLNAASIQKYFDEMFPASMANLKEAGINVDPYIKNVSQNTLLDYIFKDDYRETETRNKIKEFYSFLTKASITEIAKNEKYWLPLYILGHKISYTDFHRAASNRGNSTEYQLYRIISNVWREKNSYDKDWTTPHVDEFTKYLINLLPQEILNNIIMQFSHMLDICSSVGVNVENAVVAKLKKEFESDLKQIKFTVKEIDPFERMSWDSPFDSWSAKPAKVVFTDGIYGVELSTVVQHRIENRAIDLMSTKSLEKHFGDSYREKALRYIVRQLNSVLAPVKSKKRSLIILSHDRRVTDILRYLNFKPAGAGLVGDNLGRAYHLVNDTLSGRQGAELMKQHGFDTNDVAKLIGIIIKQMTLD